MVEQDLLPTDQLCLKHLQQELIWFMIDGSQAIVDSSKGGYNTCSEVQLICGVCTRLV